MNILIAILAIPFIIIIENIPAVIAIVLVIVLGRKALKWVLKNDPHPEKWFLD